MSIKIKLLSFFLILAVFWIFWLPGPRVSTDYHIAQKSVQTGSIFPWVFKETAVADGLGEYYAPSLWAQSMHTLFGLLALLDIPSETQSKFFGFAVLLLGFTGIWKLLGRFNFSDRSKIVGSSFFLLNTYFLLLFDGGQLSLALAYSLFPYIYFYFFRTLETDNLRDKLIFAVYVLLLSIADIRMVYLPVLTFLIYALFHIKSLKRIFLTGIITAVILGGFHFYWLLPAFMSRQIQLPQTYGRITQVETLSFSSLAHSVLLEQPNWPMNLFGKVQAPKPEFILIPIIVFSVLILVKNKNIKFWVVIALLGIFLSKGNNDPFPQTYEFLFKYLPGFSFFRDPSKFFFLIALSYSILLTFSVEALKKFKFLPALLVLYLVFLARPVFTGQMNGLISKPLLQKEFLKMGNYLGNDSNFSRIFWIPATAPLGYVSPSHSAVPADRLQNRRPFAVGTKGTYETLNFLREAPFMGEIFDVAGIGYIAYPYLSGKNLPPDNIKYYYTFLNQLSEKKWLLPITDSSIPLFKTKEHQDKFFITPNVWWIVGSDRLYEEATKSAALKLSKNSLIFSEEAAGEGNRLDGLPEAKILLNAKTQTDLAAGFLRAAALIFPAKNLGFSPDGSGWWKREAADLVWWRNFLQEKYGIDNQDFDLGGGWAIVEKNSKFEIRNSKFKKNDILLARVMESSRSGEVKFYQGSEEIGIIQTKIKGDANVRWFEVGKLSSDKELTIVSGGDINVVNALGVVDEERWKILNEKAESFKDRISNFESKNTEEQSAKVIYEEINPTKYKVKITGLSKPVLLVFSENYDPFWKINGQTPLPVYSLLNGFRIEHDGEYIVEYEPQKYVYFGLVISGITVFLLILFLIRLKKANI